MESRHVKLIGIIFMLLFLCTSGGIYLYALFSQKLVWQVAVILFLLFVMLISPAICRGYDPPTEFYMTKLSDNMSESYFLNMRDLGRMAAGVFYLLTFAPTTVSWVNNNGLFIAVILVSVANTTAFWAYILWIAVFVKQ